MAAGRPGRSTQEGVVQTVLAMMKMADNKIKSVIRRRTSSNSMSAQNVLAITGMTMLWFQ